MKKYIKAIERRLNLPKDVKARVLADLSTTISAMTEAGKSEEEICAELGAPKKVAADLNEQMKEFAYRKSPWRFVFLATALLSGLWLAFCLGVSWMGEILMAVSFPVLQREASSMGIIGGADGPTAIFVTGVSTPLGFDWDIAIMAAVLVIGIAAYLRLCRCKPRQ